MQQLLPSGMRTSSSSNKAKKRLEMLRALEGDPVEAEIDFL